MQREQIVSFLKDLSGVAAEQTLPWFRNLAEIDNKQPDGFDPVTKADKSAEKAIRNTIEKHFPEHGILGEEFGTKNENAEYVWVIDPIDGTRAFIAGIPVWGTLIGLCHNSVPIAGIMAQPFTGELFYSDGQASFFEHGGKIKALKTAANTDLSKSILMATTPELFKGSAIAAFERLSDKSRMVRYGADCYAYCMLASGQVDIVAEAGLSYYDVAALIPIIENAGGIITGWQGEPFGPSGKALASANTDLHEKALSLLADH